MANALTQVRDWTKDRSLTSTFNAARREPEMKYRAELQYAAQMLRNNEQLSNCTPETIRTSLLDVAFTGLSLSPAMGHAYLVPYGSTCTFKPSYRGLQHLVQKAGTIKRIQANTAHKQDQFKVWTDETGRHLSHSETFQGPLTHSYCIASYANGEVHIEVMTAEQLNEVQKQAEKKGPAHPWKGPWRGEMCKKAVIRRAAKHWPMEANLAHAIEVMDKYDPLFEPETKPQDADAGEILISEDQELALHAVLVDFGLDSKTADRWLQHKAEALGYTHINQLPARLFEDVKAFLADRAKTHQEAAK